MGFQDGPTPDVPGGGRWCERCALFPATVEVTPGGGATLCLRCARSTLGDSALRLLLAGVVAAAVAVSCAPLPSCPETVPDSFTLQLAPGAECAADPRCSLRFGCRCVLGDPEARTRWPETYDDPADCPVHGPVTP